MSVSKFYADALHDTPTRRLVTAQFTSLFMSNTTNLHSHNIDLALNKLPSGYLHVQIACVHYKVLILFFFCSIDIGGALLGKGHTHISFSVPKAEQGWVSPTLWAFILDDVHFGLS